MGKIVGLLMMILCFPLVGRAQNYNDDLYYTPKKKDQASAELKEDVKMTSRPTSVYVNSGTTVVVKGVDGNIRDVDEYNRRYTSYDNNFEMQDDTLVIQEKPYADRGEWVNEFNGTEDDYEYAMRLIRFRNPRLSIPVSSPLYWDIVYGVDSWNWNVYSDGIYAYAFPNFSNNLWFDWRYGNWGLGWNYPYYGGGYYPGYWGGYWGSCWGWGHHHHGWNDPWYGNGNWGRPYYYDNRPVRYSQSRPGSSSVRPSLNTRPGNSDFRPGTGSSRPNIGHVVSSRPTGSSVRPGSGSSGAFRPGTENITTRPGSSTSVSGRPSSSGSSLGGSSRPSYSRPGVESTTRPSSGYTRPSSTRSSSYSNGTSGEGYNRGGSSTYSRPSSSYQNNSSSRSSYSSPGTSRSSGSSYSGGSGSSSRSSSGGGGSSRGGRR